MNFALITQDFPPELGGIQTYSYELATRFSQKCEKFFVIAPDKSSAHEIDRDLSFPVHRISTPNPLLGIKAIHKGLSLFSRYNIRDVFHSQWQTLPISVYAKKKGIIDNIFVAVHARELVFNPFNKVPILRQAYESYKKKMLTYVDFFFPVSHFMGDLLEGHGVSEDKMKVIINGTNPERFRPTNKMEAKKSLGIEASNVLLSVSRLVSKKGIDTTVKAFGKVLNKFPDSCYLIVGDGEQKKYLEKLVKSLGIGESVRFEGSISHDNPKLINYYNACDVFVQPSKTEEENIEGCPIVYLEANACGKPVIGTYSSGIPSAIVNGKTGLLVEEKNPIALTEAINKLFGDSSLAQEMGKKGRERVINEANWDAVSEKIFTIVKEVHMTNQNKYQ